MPAAIAVFIDCCSPPKHRTYTKHHCAVHKP